MNDEMQDQLYDIYDVWYEPWYHNRMYLSLVVLLAVCALALMCWFIYKTWFKKIKVVTLEDRILELIISAENTLKDSMNIKAAYIPLSLAVKLCLSEKCNVNVNHLTDVEIQEVFMQMLNEKYSVKMAEVFKRASELKFQQQDVSALEAVDLRDVLRDDIHFVRTFFRETINKQGVGV